MAARRLEVVFVGDTNGLQKAVGQADRSVGGLGSSVVKAGKLAGAALIGAGALSLKAAGNFEQSLNVFQAVSGATGAEMKNVGKLAKQLGADVHLPATSAADAAEAMTELAKGGLSVRDSMKAARGVLQLSAAAQIGNAEAATITARALNTFALKGKDATRVSDLLAATSNASTAEITDVALAMQQVGASAHQLGIPIQDVTTAIGEMANAGVVGSDAGTSLKTMLTRLVPQTDKQAKAMKRLGINVFDQDGKFIGLRKTIEVYRQKLGGMTKEQQAAALQTLFGADAQRAANIVLLGGTKAYDKMHKAVTKQGAASDLAASKTKGFKGSLEAFKSTLETLAISFGETLLPAATSVMRELAVLASAMGDHKTLTFALVGAVGVLAAGVLTVNAAMRAYHATARAGTAVLKGYRKAQALVTGAVETARIGMGALRSVYIAQTGATNASNAAVLRHAASQKLAAAGAKVYAAAQWLVNAAMSANPIVLVVAGLVALGAALVLAWKKSDTFRRVVTGAWDAIKNAVSGAWKFLKGLADKAFGFIGDAARDGFLGPIPAIIANWDKLKGAFSDALHAVVGAIRSAAGWVADAAKKIATVVLDVIRSYVGAYVAVGKWIVNRLVDGVKAMAHAVADAAGWLKNRVVDGVKAYVSGYLTVGGWIVNRIVDGVTAVGSFAGRVGGWVKNRVTDGLHSFSDAIGDVGSWITNRVVAGALSVAGIAGKIGGWIKDRVEGAWDYVRDAAVKLGHRIGSAISDAVGTTIRGVVSVVRGTINHVIDVVNKLIGAFNKLPGPNIGKIGHLASGTMSADGGVYRVGELGPETVYLPRGASVVPASQSRQTDAAGGGPLIGQVIVQGTTDPRVIARDLAWALATR